MVRKCACVCAWLHPRQFVRDSFSVDARARVYSRVVSRCVGYTSVSTKRIQEYFDFEDDNRCVGRTLLFWLIYARSSYLSLNFPRICHVNIDAMLRWGNTRRSPKWYYDRQILQLSRTPIADSSDWITEQHPCLSIQRLMYCGRIAFIIREQKKLRRWWVFAITRC